MQAAKNYALVTGASRGIGKAIVEELLKKDPNLHIFAVARGEKDLEALTKIAPERIIAIVTDLTKTESIEKIKKTVQSTLLDQGTLSYLIHNAAIISPLGDLEYLQEQPTDALYSMIDESYRVNVIAPHLLTIALLQELKKSKDPRILFVSSKAGEIALPGIVTYSCCKAALDHLTLNMQHSLNGKIAVGYLHPGEVDTDMHVELRKPSEENLAITTQFRKAKENNKLISATTSAQFIVHLLYHTTPTQFSEKKWDIYYVRPENLPAWLDKAIARPPTYLKAN